MKLYSKVLSILLFFALSSSLAIADGDSETWTAKEKKLSTASSKEDLSSKNYNKSKKLLPGEEVVTPTGQKLKVWSTKGPVPVSRAPEPFEDREKSVLNDAHVVVDVDASRRRRVPNQVGPRPRKK